MSLEIWIPYQCRYNTLNILCQISRVRCPKVLCTLFFHACILNLCTLTHNILQAVKHIWASKCVFLNVSQLLPGTTAFIIYIYKETIVVCLCSIHVITVVLIGNTASCHHMHRTALHIWCFILLKNCIFYAIHRNILNIISLQNQRNIFYYNRILYLHIWDYGKQIHSYSWIYSLRIYSFLGS